MEQKTCIKCHETKNITEFNRKKDRRLARCKICTREQIRQHYQNNKQYYIDKAQYLRKKNRQNLLEYWSKHYCVDCGEDDPRCLTFDHVRGKKINCISSLIASWSWKRLLTEIAKCEVRCANCHCKKTASDFGYFTAPVV